MGKRIDYFDMLRGVAIIFVLICHSYSGDPLNGSFKEELYLVVRQIVTCAVPIFLAESGFFLANKHFSNRIEFFNFWSMHSFGCLWLYGLSPCFSLENMKTPFCRLCICCWADIVFIIL